MELENAAKIVLVQAVEEVLPEHIQPETIIEAHLAAGNPAEGSLWVLRRADFLINRVIGAYSAILQRLRTLHPSVWLPIGLSTFFGLASNYLGPSGKIPVLWNPIILLIAWNILIYLIMAVGFMLRRKHDTSAILPRTARVQYKHQAGPKKHEYRPSLAERIFLRPVFDWILGLKEKADEAREQANEFGKVGHRFSILLWPLIQPIYRLWLQRTLHLCAIGLAFGAVLGMYMRGLVFKYEVVWRSTFVTEPATIEKVLGYFFSPALFALRLDLPITSGLLSDEGMLAAQWIHLFAANAILLIVIPRSFLAISTKRTLDRATQNVQLDFAAPYYADLLKRANSVSPKEIEAATRTAVEDECGQISVSITEFICLKLYDGLIAPCLWNYREQGGSLRELEEALSRECMSFKPELETELIKVERNLNQRLTERIKCFLGEGGEIFDQPKGGFIEDVGSASSRAASHVGERVSGDLATLVAGTVSTSVAIVVGTLSGGFGNSLGVALLAGLVHSGPVAWVIGAVAALLATGAAYAVGRDKLRQGIKAVPIPAAALKVALWSKRYERLIAEGRKKCEESVRESLALQINQLSAVIAEHLWNRLKPIVGELQRPHTKH